MAVAVAVAVAGDLFQDDDDTPPEAEASGNGTAAADTKAQYINPCEQAYVVVRMSYSIGCLCLSPQHSAA